MRRQIELWLFWILIFMKASIFLVVSGQCTDAQNLQLLKMKNELIYSTNSSVKLVKWDQRVDCCSWLGVTCSDSNGQVIELDLSSEFITHGFNDSSSIFDLKYLQKLNLGNNSFSSIQLPARLGELNRTLTHLNLSNAGFVGQIPIEISHLTQLISLDLSSLVFPGSPSLRLRNPDLQGLVQNFSGLQELYLDGVNMSISGNNWCNVLSSSVPKLRVLSLSNCNLRGPIGDSLEKIESLSVIRLDSNNLSSTIPGWFGNFANLTTLSLVSSELFGVFPRPVFKLASLQNLDVSDNGRLQGKLPDFFDIGSLQTLVLRETKFSGKISESIGNLKNLSRLDLAHCNFKGLIPTSISSLTELRYLDLTSNKFNGSVPSFSSLVKLTDLLLPHNLLIGSLNTTNWTNLKVLQNLDLRNSSLEGAIPASLFSLPSLQKLRLSQNSFQHLQSVVDTKTLSVSQLDTLDLSSNNLQGLFPTFVFELQGIKILTMSFNNFSGGLNLAVIQQLSNLSSLDISFNRLSVEVDASARNVDFASFPTLSTLKLAFSNLKAFPGFLSYQSKLNHLDLSKNQIHGKIPNWIQNCRALSHLNLSYNFLEDFEGPVRLNDATSLSILDLHSNMLQGELPNLPATVSYIDFSRNKFMGSLPSKISSSLSYTYFLSLASNFFRGTIPESICNATYLQVLDFSNNSFTGNIPNCLIRMSENLGVLNVRRNKLSGTIPNQFTGACKLQTMDLNSNMIQGKIPKSLENCKHLEVLNIGNNKIQDTFPCWLKRVPTLRVLVLRSNEFQGSIGCPTTKGSWKMLQIIDMACNNFSGHLDSHCFKTWEGMMSRGSTNDHLKILKYGVLELNPLYYQDTVTVTFKGLEMELVKILTVFSSMDFSSNQLEGEIPEIIGNLTSLQVLNLSGNSFQGQIPASLGNLIQLESLDLSWNKLSGEIPSGLVNLTFLSLLNLSFNCLEGPIPKGSQFQTFSNTSYLKDNLSGQPLSDYCNAAHPFRNTKASSFHWQYILTGIGFGLGSGMALAPLLCLEKGRRWHDKQVDMLLSKILHWLGLGCLSFQEDEDEDGKNGLVESECDLSEDEMSAAANEAATSTRFCLYCSKIDITKKKVIHNPKCKGHESASTSFTSSLFFSSSCT